MKKEKYRIEYTLKSISRQVLWNYIGSSQGLSNWFADQVNVTGHQYTFFWNKMPQEAEQVALRSGIFIRFRWAEDRISKEYFEFRIHKLELTGNTVLEITDYAYPEEVSDSMELWNTQIEVLKRRLGL